MLVRVGADGFCVRVISRSTRSSWATKAGELVRATGNGLSTSQTLKRRDFLRPLIDRL